MSDAQIAIEAHNCDMRRSYRVVFATEDQALAYMEERKSTHAFFELGDEPIGDSFTRLLEEMHPTCEHGMSAALCMGPEHYPSAEQERAMGW